jgi:hypothetical protein
LFYPDPLTGLLALRLLPKQLQQAAGIDIEHQLTLSVRGAFTDQELVHPAYGFARCQAVLLFQLFRGRRVHCASLFSPCYSSDKVIFDGLIRSEPDRNPKRNHRTVSTEVTVDVWSQFWVRPLRFEVLTSVFQPIGQGMKARRSREKRG